MWTGCMRNFRTARPVSLATKTPPSLCCKSVSFFVIVKARLHSTDKKWSILIDLLLCFTIRTLIQHQFMLQICQLHSGWHILSSHFTILILKKKMTRINIHMALYFSVSLSTSCFKSIIPLVESQIQYLHRRHWAEWLLRQARSNQSRQPLVLCSHVLLV